MSGSGLVIGCGGWKVVIIRRQHTSGDDKLEEVEMGGLLGCAVTMVEALTKSTSSEGSSLVMRNEFEIVVIVEVMCEVKEEPNSVNGV